jgi:predicted deacetylase
MRYVILRDDDTNALTPVECLEKLYRPFLERGLPVNLAVIPNVRTDLRNRDGEPEGFLFARNKAASTTLPIGSNPELVGYLRKNPCYHIVQHGYDHTLNEFDLTGRDEIRRRLDEGARLLRQAGFPEPQAFVAPYDKLSRLSLVEATRRFRVVSTGWFELCRLPLAWWPRYALKKFSGLRHWRAGRALLLSHPGCLLSYHHERGTMLERVKETVAAGQLTVLVTHWWEYFRNGQPDEPFIRVLHETAAWLEQARDIAVVSFDSLARPPHLVSTL